MNVQTINYLLSENDRKLKIGESPHKGPLPHGYNTKFDVTKECDAEHVSRFQQLIGILRWAVDLGIIDIQKEVLLLS